MSNPLQYEALQGGERSSPEDYRLRDLAAALVALRVAEAGNAAGPVAVETTKD